MSQGGVPPSKTRETLSTQSHGPTLTAVLRGFRELTIELGGDPDRMLEAVGIMPHLVDDRTAHLPASAVGQVIENAAMRLGCDDFGMRLAERQSMRTVTEPRNRLFARAPTVRDALESCRRHIGTFHQGFTLNIDAVTPSGLHIVNLRLSDSLAPFPQLLEQLALLTHNSILWLSAGFARSRRVCFAHERMGQPAAYARRFNTPIAFGDEHDALLFSSDDMKARVAECSADIFSSEARAIEARFPVRDKDIDLQVRQLVHRMLSEAEGCTRQNVANLLSLQERTLNRRLLRKGTSFEAIRDEVRRDLAYHYLAGGELTLAEIAGRLGYADMAVLSRCCRRWFGTSPRRLRKDLLAA